MAYTSEQIRNVALCGHSGAGKTALSEAMLFNMGAISRLGRIEDGTTTSDYDNREIERKISLKLSLLTGGWNDYHFNIMDTPGYADFISEAKAALRVADVSVSVIDALTGIEVGTERTWNFAKEYGLPRLIFINKVDREEVDLDSAIETVRERLGRQVIVLQWALNPSSGFNQIIDLIGMKLLTYNDGKSTESEIPADLVGQARELHEQLVESVAETDERLMEKYFSDGELERDELVEGLRKAVLNFDLFPVLVGDAYNNVGIDQLINAIINYGPSPLEASGLSY